MSRKSHRHRQLKSKTKNKSRSSRGGGILDSLTSLFSNKPAVSDAAAPSEPKQKGSFSFWPFSNSSSSSSEPKKSSFSFWPFTALPEAPSVPYGPAQIPGRPSAPPQMQAQPAPAQPQVQPAQAQPAQAQPGQMTATAQEQLQQPQQPIAPIKPMAIGGRRVRHTKKRK